MTNLVERLQSVRVGEAVEAGGLRVFGLYWEQPPGPEYLTLDDALAGQALEVVEVSEGGSVPQLKVINRGERRAFLMAGEQLAGGKQNRVLNASLMVEGQAEVPIPVS